ncbi:MAG: histidine--tRNA ligase [Chitinophagales bacterium]|nr:histidine--tRNA ligase [Chitinophagales bacterium]MDW8428065.1 histidine--tRNA ligase [Chitinophagales bacterium]
MAEVRNQPVKPALPSGVRDFGPQEVARRRYVFDTLRRVFERYGYQPLETPVMELLSTLEGKYGEEGDRLLFRILNSGDAFAVWKEKYGDHLIGQFGFPLRDIAEKGLRYDLTVPFARYVVMNRHRLAFPFRRYQIQPVFRADRPQKGRYREFYQCDADVIGSNSLLLEAELIKIYDDAFSELGLNVTIRINSRKVLLGLAQCCGAEQQFYAMTVVLDKLDRIGLDGVEQELGRLGWNAEQRQMLRALFHVEGSNEERVQKAGALLTQTAGEEGCRELQQTLHWLNVLGAPHQAVEVDFSLARGLNYYTGIIYEVVSRDGTLKSSLGGGGRYDDLTGVFGLPGISGVGISFGADRIYDVMAELNLFPATSESHTRLLFCCMDQASMYWAAPLLSDLRRRGLPAEMYPEPEKLQKQLRYAHSRGIPYAALVGEQERYTNRLTVKDLRSGQQQSVAPHELYEKII